MRIPSTRTTLFAFLVVAATLGTAGPAAASGEPVAADDSYSVVHDDALAVDAPGVLANDSDTFDNPQVVLDQDVAHGVLTLGGDGSVAYAPDTGYVGPDSFTYHVEDVDESSAPVTSNVATVSILVTNDDPAADPDPYSVAQGGTLTVNAANGVLANDTDSDGDSLTAHLLTDVDHGTLSLAADGSFTYTPNGSFFGTDTFTYQADDGNGGTSDPATVTISVNAAGNSPPAADPDPYSVAQGGTLTVNAANGVLANDTDSDGDSLTAHLLTDVHHGTLSLAADGSFTYTPNGSFFGTDTFTYQADDGNGGTSDPATVTISVNAAGNSPPAADPDPYSVAQGGTLTVNAANGVLANDTDSDGDSLTAHLLTDVHHGTLSLAADGSFTYTPNGSFFGTDTFTYQADDGNGGTSDPATVTISVNAAGNSPPAADPDPYSVAQGGTLTVNAANGVLANDTDSDGDSLTAHLLTDVHHGTLSLAADGSFTYTPNGSFFGTDTFTYQADDGNGGTSDPATVTISVNAAGNSPPAADPDPYSVAQGGTLTVNAANGVLANDTDSDGDSLTAHLLTDVHHGTLSLAADGSFTYTPNGSFFGTDTFTYQADDGNGGTSDPATVTISVNGDRRPVAVADNYSSTPVAAGHRLEVHSATGVLKNDTDPDDDTLTSGRASGPSKGTVALAPDGSFTYTPDPGVCNASDTFTYRASDGILSSMPAAVNVSIRTPLRPTTLTLTTSKHVVTVGGTVVIRAHLRYFSKGAVVKILKRSPGQPARFLARRAPNPRTHDVVLTVKPIRRTAYFAVAKDNCHRPAKSPQKFVAVRAVGHGRITGAMTHHPTFTASVNPSQPDGTMSFVWQRRTAKGWTPYFNVDVNLIEGRRITLTLTGGVVPGVHYRVTLRWTAGGGNVPGAAPWSYFTGH